MQGRLANAIGELRSRLDQGLFPPAPARRETLGRGEGAVLVLALLALATILQLLRVGPSEALDSLWAEDSQIFLQGALSGSFWDTVLSPYAGYLVLVPRLIGEVGGLVPLRDAAAAVAIASGLVVALSGLAVWFASAGHIASPYLRGTLVALTVLAPVAGLESVASGSYVLWYMLFASFWLLLWRPATTWGAALGALFLLATGLSTPGLWFFAPLAALRALAARDRRDLLLLGAYAIGAGVQVPVIASNSEAAVEPAWTSDIWIAYAQRVVDGAAFGERLGGVAWAELGWAFLAVLLVALAAGLALGLRRSAPASRYLAAVAIPTSLLMFVASAYQRAVGAQMIWPDGTHFGTGGRYAIVPALLLVGVGLALIDRAPGQRSKPGRPPRAALAAIALLLVGLAISFDVRDTAARGAPPWNEALDSAAAACQAEGLSEARVPTSPPGFGVIVPCDRLSSASDAPVAR
jgi:hypothetical protein